MHKKDAQNPLEIKRCICIAKIWQTYIQLAYERVMAASLPQCRILSESPKYLQSPALDHVSEKGDGGYIKSRRKAY